MRSDNTEPCRAPGNSPSEKHALVIEDFPVIAMSIQDELADMGYSAAIAASEAEAVSLAQERCPDLIIADLQLAQECGIEAVRRVCGDRPIAVIFVGEDPEPIGGGGSGGAVFLYKPFTSMALRAGVETAGPISSD